MAPFFLQVVRNCPEKLSEVSFLVHSHPTLPLSGTSRGARRGCGDALSIQPQEHCPTRWCSLLWSILPFPNCHLIVSPTSPFPPVEPCLCRPLCLNPFLVRLLVLGCSWWVLYLPGFLHGRLQHAPFKQSSQECWEAEPVLLQFLQREGTLQTLIFLKSYISSHLIAVWLMSGRNQMCFISFIPCIQLHVTANTSVTTFVNTLAEAKIWSHSSFTPECLNLMQFYWKIWDLLDAHWYRWAVTHT